MKPNLEDAMKRFVRRYIKRRKPRRLHMSIRKLKPSQLKPRSQMVNQKPYGLWFGISDSWIDWCLSEYSCMLRKNIYELVLDESRILKIQNIAEFEAFEKEYSCDAPWADAIKNLNYPNSKRFVNYLNDPNYINYPKIAESYDGIEISPYFWEKRLKSFWYYGWDAASGCIWNPHCILNILPFATFDKKSGEYIKCGLQPSKIKVQSLRK